MNKFSYFMTGRTKDKLKVYKIYTPFYKRRKKKSKVWYGLKLDATEKFEKKLKETKESKKNRLDIFKENFLRKVSENK